MLHLWTPLLARTRARGEEVHTFPFSLPVVNFVSFIFFPVFLGGFLGFFGGGFLSSSSNRHGPVFTARASCLMGIQAMYGDQYAALVLAKMQAKGLYVDVSPDGATLNFQKSCDTGNTMAMSNDFDIMLARIASLASANTVTAVPLPCGAVRIKPLADARTFGSLCLSKISNWGFRYELGLNFMRKKDEGIFDLGLIFGLFSCGS